MPDRDSPIAVPVKSFDSGDSNRELHTVQVTRGAEFPMFTVRTRLPESAATAATIDDLEVQFAGQAVKYRHIPFQVTRQAARPESPARFQQPCRISRSIRRRSSHACKKKIPVHVEMTWRPQ
jgi:hypothetical protein